MPSQSSGWRSLSRDCPPASRCRIRTEPAQRKRRRSGSSSSYGSGSACRRRRSAGTVAGGTIDSPQSQGLSDYLKHHSLPLVGAQVVTSPSGGQQVILFGFVASDFGKTDAEQKARHYLKDLDRWSSTTGSRSVPNWPAAHGSSRLDGQRTSRPAMRCRPTASDPYASSGSIQDYQNNMPPDAQAYQAQGAAAVSSISSTTAPRRVC